MNIEHSLGRVYRYDTRPTSRPIHIVYLFCYFFEEFCREYYWLSICRRFIKRSKSFHVVADRAGSNLWLPTGNHCGRRHHSPLYPESCSCLVKNQYLISWRSYRWLRPGHRRVLESTSLRNDKIIVVFSCILLLAIYHRTMTKSWWDQAADLRWWYFTEVRVHEAFPQPCQFPSDTYLRAIAIIRNHNIYNTDFCSILVQGLSSVSLLVIRLV